MTDNMWKIPVVNNLRTPTSIMKEQAINLTNQTNGLLLGNVGASGNADLIMVSLRIMVPSLNGYTFNVITYHQNIVDLYPGQLQDYLNGKSGTVNNEAEFNDFLREVLTSPKMQTVLTNLLAQAQAV